MNPAIIAAVGGASAVIGFVAVWVRIGAYKGTTDTRLSAVEKQAGETKVKVDEMTRENAGLAKDMASFMSEIRTSIRYISEGIADLKKKQESDDAQKK